MTALVASQALCLGCCREAKLPGESCTVLCAGAFEGPGGGYVCGLDGTFVGNVSCQDLLARV